MDIATLLGIFIGIGLILVSILQNSGLDLFVSAPSVMIVLGGTFAATLVAYPVNELFRMLGHFIRVFITRKSDLYELMDTMVSICSIARKGGVLAIESKLNMIENDFLKKGLRLTVDGKDEHTVVTLMKREIKQIQQSHKDGWEILNDMGKFAPAFGMVGTLIGLIQMLASLEDVSTVGPRMAVALITTFYGALLANLVFLPMAVKLKRRSAAETLEMNLVLEGITYIRKGVNPRFMKETLENYIDNAAGKKIKKEVEEEARKGTPKKAGAARGPARPPGQAPGATPRPAK
ncbi:MotA1 [Nitrospina gracilis 3/211]|uniref:MotA1 n=1 Tax=Nitrospina gracilis (strain 3/211) TaxID=1266370 RepID=M1YNA6_NITG3|nr:MULTISPECIES: motility protein A [Nitrospina]MCF8724722.1 chemotaxis protein MotA [Nitrospina sp. Nb-3]CCQ91994.1 MotA1 [Nitrospina gracilis 3/211]